MTNYRAGFVTFVGRPNVGKSTLTNALVGEKIAIISDKPQTTRRAVRGIVHREDGQIIIVDTPGMHRPRTLLGERLNDVVHATVAEVDVIGFCVPANEPVGPGDRFINEQLDEAPKARKIAIVTKAETVSRDVLASRLVDVQGLREWDDIIPVSAAEDIQLDTLTGIILGLLPESEPLYPSDMKTEESFEQRAAELVREAALEGVHDELPHSIAVTVEEIVTRDDGVTRELYVNIVVERDSQKGIIIGRGGERLKRIREQAQREISQITEGRVIVSIRVKVAKEWQRDPKQLGRLGF
ncbi:GTPase Era [Pseudoclavibacter sp. RFBJ3]|uniref:GTPase Era n=1 Tax=unclassified Pseudoclavibacter TaxID=2615177 RepID=UPI000CE78D95|nr:MULTISPECIES: GTPase Era [unclassified Pseudoclavibacter]MBF4549545.1 GTPase Era [Pseudoclavibacter sp. VKM Ac-2888]PPF39909.1 GTPase Era [Pseudoclavibacter sp. AY1H1]PPF76032.1 GTPase Era [Pseudoclavibacter sp. Z016]PPF84871.1 GTPase Era [Pseudoclavibacter sp. RFBJ5]PPF93875.1 GTPase Era [Pseudoclavibacter sp. RFBJ3]